jgi:hypothetical protein
VYSSGAARLVYMCTVVYTRAAIMPCRPSRHYSDTRCMKRA